MVMGLIAGLGLTIALFVADVAFTDKALQSDAKLGAVIAPLIGFVCWGLSKLYDFTHQDVAEEERHQLEEEMEKEEKHLTTVRARGQSIEASNVQLPAPASAAVRVGRGVRGRPKAAVAMANPQKE